MEKINIAELLKYCPKGMELYSPLCGDCKLYDVNDYGIRIETPNKDTLISLYHDGRYCSGGEIMLFPKGKTTWEGFVPPCKFKDGDIIYVKDKHNNWCSIMNKCENEKLYTYVDICFNSNRIYCYNPTILCECSDITEQRFATEEERQKLFDGIKAKGYKWNAETKTLEKLVVPKFKVGDRIVKKNSVCVPILITNVSDEFYYSTTESSVGVLSISEQDEYVLLPNKFDINTLVSFESRVLVRNIDGDLWKPAIYGFSPSKGGCYVVGGTYWNQCIRYEGNEHLRGKTDDCDDFYKNWK